MAFPGIPQFQDGLMLQSGTQMQAFVHNTLSVDISLKAHQGGGQQFATLVDAVVCVVSRVTSAGDSIQLPPTNGRLGFGPYLGGLQILIINSQSNACQLFGNFFENSTIGGVSGATGVSIASGASIQLVCGAPGVWVSIVGTAGGGLPITGGALQGFLEFLTATGQVGLGTNQASALVLTAQNVVMASFPTGTGVRLPALADISAGALGLLTLLNKDGTHSGQVYPPVGGQINALGTNNPVTISINQQLQFIPDGVVTGQWWV